MRNTSFKNNKKKNFVNKLYFGNLQDAFKMPNPIIPTSPQVSSPAVPAGSPPEPDDATKQQMVHTMAQQSGMNLEFSTK